MTYNAPPGPDDTLSTEVHTDPEELMEQGHTYTEFYYQAGQYFDQGHDLSYCGAQFDD